jgi:hypothetical protein
MAGKVEEAVFLAKLAEQAERYEGMYKYCTLYRNY